MNNKDTVIIVFQQIFGDAVLISSALEGYVELYHNRFDYRVIMLMRPSVAQFMLDVLEIPEEIEIQGVDFKRFLEDYGYYRQVMNRYKYMADTIIVPGTSLSAEIFSSANGASQKIGLVKSVTVQWPPIMAFFSRIAYTQRVVPEHEQMMLQRHRTLLNYLGHTEYKAKLSRLQLKEKIISDEKYCVLCPGASKKEKCWPAARYTQVIDYIYEKYHMKTYLCGGAEDIIYEDILKDNLKHTDSIISYIGKTTYSEWSAIVQYAELVIGNDSATMHIAAAAKRKAICITGIYDKYQFFPYRVDEFGEEDKLPVVIYHDMPCEGCRTRGYNSGYKNRKCREQIKKGKCAICVDIITVDEVIVKVDGLLKDSNVEYN